MNQKEKHKPILDDGQSTTQKINRFFKNNNYLIVLGILTTQILTMCDNASYKEQMEETLKSNTSYLKKNISTIAYVDSNGIVATLNRKPITYQDSRIINAIINDTTYPLLQGSEDIMGEHTHFKNAKEMVENNPYFKNLFYYKTEPKTRASVAGVLTNIYKVVNNLYYPEFITVLSKKVYYFNTTKDRKNGEITHFNTKIVYRLKTKSWISQLNKWVDQKIIFPIEIKGDIYPSKFANSDNILGYVITKMNVKTLTKPDLNSLR